MSKKVNSANLINKFKTSFKCPLCDQSIKVINLSSVVCTNNHTFDIAKQGYINFMTRSVNSNYGKDLFETRYKLISRVGTDLSLRIVSCSPHRTVRAQLTHTAPLQHLSQNIANMIS